MVLCEFIIIGVVRCRGTASAVESCSEHADACMNMSQRTQQWRLSAVRCMHIMFGAALHSVGVASSASTCVEFVSPDSFAGSGRK
jgi:hypothetical protein